MENPINMDDLGVPLFLETPTLKSAIHWFDVEFQGLLPSFIALFCDKNPAYQLIWQSVFIMPTQELCIKHYRPVHNGLAALLNIILPPEEPGENGGMTAQ